MSGSTTTPTRGSSAGAAYAAENAVPSAEVSVSVPRSATSPDRGGAGGRLSWSWHMPKVLPPVRPVRAPGSAAGDLAGRLGPPAEDPRGHLTARLGQPLVLLVRLADEPVQQFLVDPVVDLGDLAQGLEAGPLAEHGGRDELELDQVRQRRAGQQPAVELQPRDLLPQPGGHLLVLADRDAERLHRRQQRRLLLAQFAEQLLEVRFERLAAVRVQHAADQLDAAGRRHQVVVDVDAEEVGVADAAGGGRLGHRASRGRRTSSALLLPAVPAAQPLSGAAARRRRRRPPTTARWRACRG